MRWVRSATFTGALLFFAGCGETVHSLGTLPDEIFHGAPCSDDNTGGNGTKCSGAGGASVIDAGSSSGGSSSGGSVGAGGVPEPGDAGSGGAAPLCKPQRAVTTRRGLNLLLLVDASLSVVLQPTWTSLTAAISRYVSDPQNAGIGLGVTYYGSTCTAEDYEKPTVPISDLPGNAQAINASYPPPIGGKPIVAALAGAEAYVHAIAGVRTERTAALVLVTDGILDPVCGGTEATASKQAELALAAAPSVKTFVVGLGAGPTLVDLVDLVNLVPLDAIAKAGGTGTAERVEVNLTTNEELTTALESVTAKARPCSFALPSGFDAARTALEWKDGSGKVTTWPHVATSAACGTKLGVYASPSSGFLDLCPTSCTALGTSPDGVATAVEACTVR